MQRWSQRRRDRMPLSSQEPGGPKDRKLLMWSRPPPWLLHQRRSLTVNAQGRARCWLAEGAQMLKVRLPLSPNHRHLQLQFWRIIQRLRPPPKRVRPGVFVCA